MRTFASEVRSLPHVFASSSRLGGKKGGPLSRWRTARSVNSSSSVLVTDPICFPRSAKITDGARHSRNDKGCTA